MLLSIKGKFCTNFKTKKRGILMIENKEIELKMLLTEDEFNELLQHYLPSNFIKQTNYYYSASNNSINQSIRIREKEGNFLFTLKEKMDNYVQEYEKYTHSLNLYDDKEVLDILKQHNLLPPYNEIGHLTTERYTCIIPYKAELCFDVNHYYGITDYEIEYEVTHKHNYQEEFLNILKKANITYKPNLTSKVKRCINAKKAADN